MRSKLLERQNVSPKAVLRAPLEAEEGRELASWLRKRKLCFVHVPNEGIRSPQAAARLRAAGLSRGAPDYLVFTPAPPRVGRKFRRGAAIELKRAKVPGCKAPSGPDKFQRKWLADLASLGWETRVCYGAADAIAWLESLGY